MGTVYCPWCHKRNEVEMWELENDDHIDIEICRHCGMIFEYDVDFSIGQYSGVNAEKVIR